MGGRTRLTEPADVTRGDDRRSRPGRVLEPGEYPLRIEFAGIHTFDRHTIDPAAAELAPSARTRYRPGVVAADDLVADPRFDDQKRIDTDMSVRRGRLPERVGLAVEGDEHRERVLSRSQGIRDVVLVVPQTSRLRTDGTTPDLG